MNKVIVVEGLDNSGKNTWVAKNHPTATVIDFPIRDGKHAVKINSFLAGKTPYSPEVEDWFLENRLEWYTTCGSAGTTCDSACTAGTASDSARTTVLVRSGISYLVYKWYRTGIRPTDEEFSREKRLLADATVVFLDTEFEDNEKREIYDRLPTDEKEILRLLFTEVIEALS